MRLWVPSQNGLVTDPPQRHKENAGLPVRSYFWPSASTNSIEPSGASTRYGPFFLTVIFTAAMKPPFEMQMNKHTKIPASGGSLPDLWSSGGVLICFFIALICIFVIGIVHWTKVPSLDVVPSAESRDPVDAKVILVSYPAEHIEIRQSNRKRI